ncbi:ATP-dependent helicase [Paenibacillus selenitireducens]|uniref:ATP-dependent helicase n=1 Tax=Paenibacillus selenitireducens TaxID=1324314 RepID=A0A1T2XAS2_9BACL|nr:helicase C-terminal domain-containing protein [Paenibacillus selenitireducens]OPA77004.1 ATP-dependent helicase [Paenibacillus selenitireducens]
MSDSVQIAVRPLVEYVFRSGSIDSGFRSTSTMLEGTKAHQKIQKQYGERDQKEVYLQAEIPCGDLIFRIDGRCDGLLVSEDGRVTIEEIKSTGMNLEYVTADSYPVHWAQAKCYAYMYARDHQLAEIDIQLTYVHVDTEEQKRFLQATTIDELDVFVREVVARYAPYAHMLHQHRTARNRSIEELAFPFERYRVGQRKLAGSVYKSIEEGVNLFAKAPTGIGKTISTTYPAIKAMAAGTLEHLYYLTAKTITRTAAEEALRLMEAKGLQMHAVTITAKEKICFQEEMRCRKEDCEFADGYYDRINEAILDLLSNETLMTRPVIEQYARKHRVCPFEFSLDVAYAADMVICDYNYIFDPRVSLKRMFSTYKHHTALLIDEAHNLVDRAREMFSSSLNKADFLALQREFKGIHKDIHQAAKEVNSYFIALKKRMTAKHVIEPQLPEELVAFIENFVFHAERYLVTAADEPAVSKLLDTYFAAQNFLRTAKLYDERYVTFSEIDREGVTLKLFCLDPSHLLQEMGKGYRSHIYFSATLTPMGFYRDMLGADAEDYTLTLGSPFAREQLDVYIQPLSTRYHDREHTKHDMVLALHELVRTRPGNYLFFFPSYAYMNLIYEDFVLCNPQVTTLLQRSDLSEEERENFLAAFDANNEETLIGFAVMGGIFSEGIDLVGDRLTGVVVVGVGLPQLGVERDIIRDYFNAAGKRGYDYAYVFPGMNKVLQAGGRLIRTETDRGVLVLIDDRYLTPYYQRLMPDEWQDYTVIHPGESLD